MIKVIDGKARLEYSQELLDMLQPGKAVRIFYNEGNINNQIRHIRAIVDDEYVVYRVRHYGKQNWSYRVRGMHRFQVTFENGNLSIVLGEPR